MKPLNTLEWAMGAVQKHGWYHANRIALQCQKTPNEYWAKITDWIKANAPAGALEKPLDQQ